MKESPTCLPSALKFAVAGKKKKMNLLSNAFSLLELDAEDDRVNIASSSKSKSSNNGGTLHNFAPLFHSHTARFYI